MLSLTHAASAAEIMADLDKKQQKNDSEEEERKRLKELKLCRDFKDKRLFLCPINVQYKRLNCSEFIEMTKKSSSI